MLEANVVSVTKSFLRKVGLQIPKVLLSGCGYAG
jgi:hypothetical protein